MTKYRRRPLAIKANQMANGDWHVRELDGNWYTLSARQFERLYEPVEEKTQMKRVCRYCGYDKWGWR